MTSPAGAGIRALSISLPSVVKTNDYWRRYFPEVLKTHEEQALARLWAKPAESTKSSADHDAEMLPYLSDPFRGTSQRYVLGPGETPLVLQERAARAALEAAHLAPDDVGLMIVASLLPDEVFPGNSAPLSVRLGLRGASWNIESACASAIIAFQTACAFVQAGRYEHVLVVVSCTYSTALDDRDTMSWFLGDGAGAFVVSRIEGGQGILGMKTMHTGATCGTARHEVIAATPDGYPVYRFRPGKNAGKLLRDITGVAASVCCKGAADDAGIPLGDVDFFVFNTPNAWFPASAARTIGVDPRRTVNPHALYANIGPALTPVNLWHAAHEGRISKGDLVMVYGLGSISSAAAVLMRWGDVAIAPPPPAPRYVDPEPGFLQAAPR
jgi:3-oxoacyl-[acyl-carrier-protein] synthase-3